MRRSYLHDGGLSVIESPKSWMKRVDRSIPREIGGIPSEKWENDIMEGALKDACYRYCYMHRDPNLN